MLSHQIGAGQRADLKELAETRAELLSLRCLHEQATRRAQQQGEDKERRIRALKTRLSQTAGFQAKLSAMQSRLDSLNSGRELQALTQSLLALDSRFADLEQRYQRAQKQRWEWCERSRAMESRVRHLETELADKAAECTALERILATDNSSDCNGRFDRHDGGLEDNRQRLEAMMATADAGVCPTDCVSHDAYYRVKRFCKRLGKPCILLRSSGISSFAKAITMVAN